MVYFIFVRVSVHTVIIEPGQVVGQGGTDS